MKSISQLNLISEQHYVQNQKN